MRKCSSFLLLLSSVGAAFCQVSVLTNRYDNLRTGANSKETVLNTSNVKVATFGKLWSYAVDGSIFAQPLYVPDVPVPGRGTHNVLYVCTMNDTVYAFDADSPNTLWSVNFTNPGAGIIPVPIASITGFTNKNITGIVGIESTPVIDASTGTLYLVARTMEGPNYVQRLHALDITTGAEKFGGPVVIQGSVPGNGSGSAGGTLPFDPRLSNQRPGLALANNKVIIEWAGHEEIVPWHGWVMAYDKSTLAQAGIYCTTPNGLAGGIWNGGRAPVVDASGNLYCLTGNGTTGQGKSLGESALRISTKNGLNLADYFVASDFDSLNAGDVDLGSGGLMMIPGAGKLIGGGKEGILYLLNPANMGHFASNDAQIPQKISATTGQIKPGPAYWRSASLGQLIYLWGEGDYLKAWHFNGSTVDLPNVMASSFPAPPGAPGATLTVSANGDTDGTGIVWASMSVALDADQGVVPGMLRALNASNPGQELWNSLQNQARDDTGTLAKFVPPVVVNGKVYMASWTDYTYTNYLNVYGLLP